MALHDVNRTIDAIWRIESPKLIAGLTRVVGDIGVAEELAQDAVVAALVQWPESGIPRNPGAWLMAIAKRRAIDRFRRDDALGRKHELVLRDLQLRETGEREVDALNDEIEDDLLRLIFIACHPVLSVNARVALTLRLLGGLTTAEIARAFLLEEPTIAQRIVRAKRTLSEANVPFEVPGASERVARLSSVLEVIYLVFNEGYSATGGDDLIKPALCVDALRLGRVLAELAPDEAEVHGLVALMEIQASRSAARVGPFGEPILLLEQDRGKWNHLLIQRGLAALERAERLGGTLGPYALQAMPSPPTMPVHGPPPKPIGRASRHLYDALAEVIPTPVVQLNRAVAIGMAYGPAAGLEIVDALTTEPALRAYHLFPSVRGDLLEKARAASAKPHGEFERARSAGPKTQATARSSSGVPRKWYVTS